MNIFCCAITQLYFLFVAQLSPGLDYILMCTLALLPASKQHVITQDFHSVLAVCKEASS